MTEFSGLPFCRMLRLTGNYENSCFRDGCFGGLHLVRGVFRNMDLRSAQVDTLTLSMSSADFSGIRLPRIRKEVCFLIGDETERQLRNEISLEEFCLPEALATELLGVWDSSYDCAELADRLFRSAWRDEPSEWVSQTLWNILSNCTTTAAELLAVAKIEKERLSSLLHPEVVAALNLVVRRNQVFVSDSSKSLD